MTTHGIHNRQISMAPAGFEPGIPASKRQQTYALTLTLGPFSSIPSNSLSMKRPENTEEDPDNPGLATEADI